MVKNCVLCVPRCTVRYKATWNLQSIYFWWWWCRGAECRVEVVLLVKETKWGLINESYQWLLLSVCGSLDCSKEHGSMQIKALKTQTGFCQLLEHVHMNSDNRGPWSELSPSSESRLSCRQFHHSGALWCSQCHSPLGTSQPVHQTLSTSVQESTSG